jgi:hypothetical protein
VVAIHRSLPTPPLPFLHLFQLLTLTQSPNVIHSFIHSFTPPLNNHSIPHPQPGGQEVGAGDGALLDGPRVHRALQGRAAPRAGLLLLQGRRPVRKRKRKRERERVGQSLFSRLDWIGLRWLVWVLLADCLPGWGWTGRAGWTRSKSKRAARMTRHDMMTTKTTTTTTKTTTAPHHTHTRKKNHTQLRGRARVRQGGREGEGVLQGRRPLRRSVSQPASQPVRQSG